MSDETKKEKAQPEELNEEQLDEVAGGVVKRAVMLSPEELSAKQKLTTDTSNLRRRS